MIPEFKLLDDTSPAEPGPTLTPDQEKRHEIMFSRYLGLEEHLTASNSTKASCSRC